MSVLSIRRRFPNMQQLMFLGRGNVRICDFHGHIIGFDDARRSFTLAAANYNATIEVQVLQERQYHRVRPYLVTRKRHNQEIRFDVDINKRKFDVILSSIEDVGGQGRSMMASNCEMPPLKELEEMIANLPVSHPPSGSRSEQQILGYVVSINRMKESFNLGILVGNVEFELSEKNGVRWQRLLKYLQPRMDDQTQVSFTLQITDTSLYIDINSIKDIESPYLSAGMLIEW
ncbi:uncharacterized protein KY384_004085 [Bacidia gigantensis]|uniref:uncharacterized protein n=1 Tax=Bacidia gigantensis TaxID=2732470 RepID=UPI001D054AD1|nr:uncharacterized protein KY384_004085 [Bacidia gigantensis]KAG8530728.1 hypothetical protein KY384_004085 [Bacidia gigantensis]